MADRAATIIQAAAARATIRALGMQAENQQRAALGQAMAYREEDFVALIDDEGIGHNAVITILNEGR